MESAPTTFTAGPWDAAQVWLAGAQAPAAQRSRPAQPAVASLWPDMAPPTLPDPTAAQAARDERLAALLRAAAGGDGRAFESFYDETSRQALAVVRRIVGDAHAEDVLADSYFQAWRDASRFDSTRGNAIAWLLTLARSRALDRLRQETLRHGGATGALEYEADEHEASPLPGPDALLESTETLGALHHALAQLSANERWVLGLAYFKDMTQAEIAGQTGMPLGTVKSLMTRSQQKLRLALQPAAPAVMVTREGS